MEEILIGENCFNGQYNEEELIRRLVTEFEYQHICDGHMLKRMHMKKNSMRHVPWIRLVHINTAIEIIIEGNSFSSVSNIEILSDVTLVETTKLLS